MSEPNWRPRARREALAARARLLTALRAFFAARDVMEVTPPVVSRYTVTAPEIESIRAHAPAACSEQPLYLQTSPEYAMKRLLAASSGAIYAIGPAFRDGEIGPRHNPEFTLLEWYRPGFDLHALMREVGELIGALLPGTALQHSSYRDAFRQHAGVDPMSDDSDRLRHRAGELGLNAPQSCDRDEVLDFLMSTVVEPRLGVGAHFIHGFPPSQAALAEIAPGPPAHALRFELFVSGIELANGFQELRNGDEQRQRFEQDLAARRARGQSTPALDERLLAALATGLPPVSGVALGVDRLLMIMLGLSDIRDTLAFPFDRA